MWIFPFSPGTRGLGAMTAAIDNPRPAAPSAGMKHWLGTWTAATLAQLQPSLLRNELGILMYHRVVNKVPGQPFPTWNVTPNRFRRQLTGLLRNGFRAWPLRKVLDHRANQREIPRNVFVVTFDDAYECVFTRALPVLEELRIPATVFLSTAYIDSPEPFPFDDWPAKGKAGVPTESWRPLSQQQCLALQASGLIELGAHTHTHDDFRGRPQDLQADLQHNLACLQARFGLHNATFAFPFGTKSLGYSGSLLAVAARETGVLCALTTESEIARLTGDVYDWGRFNVEAADTAATLAGKLTGWFNYVRGSIRQLESSVWNWPAFVAANVKRTAQFCVPIRSA